VELRHLRYFAAGRGPTAPSTRAAQTLHLTQPALSRQVKDLEDELGVPLLVRGKNAVTLTDAGELFYEALFAALEAHHAAAILAEGVASIMPRALVTRPFSPALPAVAVNLGIPAVRRIPTRRRLQRLLREEVERNDGRPEPERKRSTFNTQ